METGGCSGSRGQSSFCCQQQDACNNTQRVCVLLRVVLLLQHGQNSFCEQDDACNTTCGRGITD